jgi:ADP-heptose:LPS heptosyltransferase
MMISGPKNIVISRTDSIGDVCLTLPLAGILKEKFPLAKIIFLGNNYTRPVIECCKHVDEVWEWNELSKLTQAEQVAALKKANIDTLIHVFPRKEIARLAKKARIKNRIGTSHRLFHLTSCNFRPGFTRKNSDLHESQLNAKLLLPFGISRHFELSELRDYAAFQASYNLPETFEKLINDGKKNLILHPKSQGSAREWDIQNFIALANSLKDKHVNVFFTGTEKEGLLFRHLLPKSNHIIDLTGKMTLPELIVFISRCDILIAASTGPLHIAGLTGINAIGLFSDKKPIHPGRWKPLGNKVVIIEEKNISNTTQPLNLPLRDVLGVAEELL